MANISEIIIIGVMHANVYILTKDVSFIVLIFFEELLPIGVYLQCCNPAPLATRAPCFVNNIKKSDFVHIDFWCLKTFM